jgi:chromate transport protein ChrA
MPLKKFIIIAVIFHCIIAYASRMKNKEGKAETAANLSVCTAGMKMKFTECIVKTLDAGSKEKKRRREQKE